MFPWALLLCLHVGQKFCFSASVGWLPELLSACEYCRTDNKEMNLFFSQLMLIIEGSALPLESYKAFRNCERVENHRALCV